MDFAQNMQTYFVYTTQGAEGFSSSRARTLSEIEIRSILKTFFMDKPKIEPNEEFEHFLRWFNHTVDKLKAPAFNRFFLDGFIIVSIQNEDIEAILKTQPKGTFIIKCRTSDPGQLGFIYKASNTTFSKRPLVEYKVSVKSLANSILLTPDLALVGKLDPATYQFSVLSKKEAFSPYMDHTVPYDVIEGEAIPACYSGYPVVASDIVFEKEEAATATMAAAAAVSAVSAEDVEVTAAAAVAAAAAAAAAAGVPPPPVQQDQVLQDATQGNTSSF